MDKYTIYIFTFVIIYYLFISDKLFDKNTEDHIKHIPVIATISAIFFIIILSVISIFIFRTTYYINYLDNNNNDITSFNSIRKINLSIPDKFIQPLLHISNNYGNRIEIPRKRQKAISLNVLKNNLPELITWYESLPEIISNIVQDNIIITPLSQPNSLCLIVYEKEGDYIDWHFDTNHYNGRFFTLLLPVTFTPTCGNYQYIDKNKIVQTVELSKSEAILFEGNKIYHRGKKLCRNQRRVVLSCTFSTSVEILMLEKVFQKIKNIGIFGEL
jgi:hypothetical protein